MDYALKMTIAEDYISEIPFKIIIEKSTIIPLIEKSLIVALMKSPMVHQNGYWKPTISKYIKIQVHFRKKVSRYSPSLRHANIYIRPKLGAKTEDIGLLLLPRQFYYFKAILSSASTKN